MTIYFLLIGYILLCPAIVKAFSKDCEKQKQQILVASLIGIFLLLALKAPSVGRDTPGYKRMYDSFRSASWDNFYQMYWTETGFEFLEMLFSHVLKLDFQAFTAIIYAFMCLSYYHFLNRYSEDVTFSMLIYVCFGFLVFDLSGIRFAFSLAIALFAFPFGEKKGVKSFFTYFAIVLLAAQIHRGAYICIFLYFVAHNSFEGWKSLFYIAFPIALYFSGPVLKKYLSDYTRDGIGIQVTVGGNVFFYLSILLLIFIIDFLSKQYMPNDHSVHDEESIFFYNNIGLQTRLFYVGTVLVIFLGEQTVVRTANYGLFFMIPLLPNALSLLNDRSKTLLKSLLLIFLFVYFYVYKIIPNDLDIGPYIPFWN